MTGPNVGTVSVKVTPDTSRFWAELKAKLEAIDDAINIPVRLDFDDNGIRQKVEAAVAGLDQTVEVKLDVDRSMLDRLQERVSGVFSSAGGSGRGLGVFSSFVDNLAVAAAVASIAAPALALVTGALAAMPAIVAGIATPIGVIALGMEGLANASRSLGEPLKQLKADISGVFEQRLTSVFEGLSRSMPKLSGPLSSVAHGISDVVTSLINAISTGPGMANLQGTISNIAKTISTMAPGVGSLTNGLLGLANNVSAKFPQFGQWFNDAADGFAKFVEKATADGSLNTAMSNLGGTLKEIADLVGDLAIQGFDFLKDPAFGETMKQFVADTRELVNDVLPGLKTFFTDLAGAINAVVQGIDKIQAAANKLPAFMKGENPKPEKGAEPGNPFTSKDAPWRDLLGQGGQAPKGLVDPGFGEAIRGWFTAGFEKLNFGSMLGVLEEPLKRVWDSLGIGMGTASAETGLQMGQTLGTKLGQGFQTAQATITPQIQSSLQAATLPLQQLPGLFQQAFQGVGAAVTGSMANVVGAVAGAGQQMVAAFTASFSQIPGVAATTFGQVAAAAAAGMANVVTAITSGAAQCVAAVTNMGTQIVAALQSAASGAQAAGAAVGQGMAAGIRSGIGAAVAAARDLAAQVTAASQVKLGIKSPSKVFTEIGAQTAQGLQDGLEGGFAGVIARATELSGKLTEAVNGGLAGVDGKALTDGIKQQLAELELQRKQLKVDKDAIPKEDKEKRAGVQGQIDQIQAIKDQLALQKDQLGFSQQYGDELDSHKDSVTQANNIITESIASMIDGIKGFAMANVNQFASDLGISGEGAIPQIANIGLDWATSTLSNLVSSPFQQGGGTNITVNSVDDALAAKQTIDNKKALQFAGR